jgi:asparagine synthase (glutamine-hydrolysing)
MRALGKGETYPYEMLRRGVAGEPIFYGGVEAFSGRQKDTLLGTDVRARLGDLTTWDALRPIRARFEDRAWDASHLHWMTYLDLNLRLPELLLSRVDKMSMGVSLEGRVPFLDHKFVELAMSIPARTKTKDRTLKYILKKAVRGLIPDEIIDRPKQGFGVPVYEWFFDRLGAMARRELAEFCSETNYLNRAAVDRLFERKRGPQLWYLLNFALWWKHYIKA